MCKINCDIKAIICVITICLISAGNVQGDDMIMDSLLNQLDATIVEYKTYMDIKEERILSLKSIAQNVTSNPEQLFLTNTRIYNEYRSYNIDSAIFYLNKNMTLARQNNRADWILETHFHLAYIFAASGLYKESMDIIGQIDRKNLPKDQFVNYYSRFELLYNELANNSRLSQIAREYKTKAFIYRDSLINCLDTNYESYHLVNEQRLFDSGKIQECIEMNRKLLADVKPNSPDYANLAYRMARCYQAQNDITGYKKYLILSAIADIKAAVKDNTSLNLLAAQLYKENEIDRAYVYVKFALADANFFNARLRLVQVSNILPLINEAYQIKSDKQKAKLRLLLITISLLLVFLAIALGYIYIQMRRLALARNHLQDANNQLLLLNNELSNINNQFRELNLELFETNKIKEQYIGLFLSICSTYIDKLENYRRMANKMLTNGKVAELHETTKSKEFVENELREFYENFDNTFLHIFPNFVDDLNKLLVDEERIILKNGELLNTELRIFALIRLGISDSSKIAALLRYSVNTIYNYRVKIKNKSKVDRDEFENRVMKIGSFSK